MIPPGAFEPPKTNPAVCVPTVALEFHLFVFKLPPEEKTPPALPVNFICLATLLYQICCHSNSY
jgi:hypothetical protein